MRFLLLVSLASLSAAQRPDFSGEWRLPVDKGAPARTPRIVQIDHRDPTLLVHVLESGRHDVAFYSTDAVERPNSIQGKTAKTVARWDGPALVVTTSGDSAATIIERYELISLTTLVLKRRIQGQEQVLVHELVPLRAGVAQADISPANFMPMYGYRNRSCGPANGHHDPLMAKVLILESAAARIAIVSLDLGSMVSARLRDEASRMGFSLLLLSASHTHSGPLFLAPEPDEAQAGFLRQAEDKILEALKQAAGRMFVARLSTARGSAQLGYNRLVLREHGRARAAFNNLERIPYGPLDAEYMLVEVSEAGVGPRALLIHHSIHPVVLGPTNCKYSADFPGAMNAAIQTAMPGLQSMFIQGGAGDMNPLFLGRAGNDAEDFAQVTRMGELLAADVLRTRAKLRDTGLASHPIRTNAQVLRLDDRWESGKTIEVGIAAAIIGRDIAIAAMPGEPLHTLQTAWKQRADFAFPLFYGYTYSAGGEWPGYIPDLKSAAYGGYGADVSTRVEVGAGEKILERLLQALYGLRGYWSPAPGLP